MEVLGRLAGGVAHDFNNLLTAITGYSELALADLDKGGAQRDDLESIKRAAARASSLTRQLLAFSRKQVLEPKVVDLNSLVTNLEKMLRRLIGEDITLVAELAPNLGRVAADPGQIEQVVLNLAVNARDAMPQGGRLTIETRNVDWEDSTRTSNGGDLQRAYVGLAITDTGCGMDDKTKSRIFEPFFTTKEVGKGTGLGLATVYGIVEQSGGHIEVTSEIDRGSAFRVFLPRIAANTETTDSGTCLEEPSATARGETILVVEDQDDVRALTRRNLERCGYTLLEARSGAEALEVSQRHRGRIHLMVTDVVMPNMSGLEVAKRLAASRPDMKTLFMSGYTDDAVVRHGLPPGGGGILQKPFNAATLAARVRDMLSDTGNESGSAVPKSRKA
jgi:CheY-like chemotaxis protein